MSVTWLHISDLHLRGGDPYDRDVVLRALVASVGKFRESGRRPDLILTTGDVAHGGKEDEYKLATTFFDDLLKATGLERRHLFVVPGNHDVDRDLCTGLVRSLERAEADGYFDPTIPKHHLTQKQGAFLRWYNEYFEGIRSLPSSSTCGPVEAIEIRGCRVGVLCLNSAFFCQDNNDHEKLWIGRRCLGPAIENLQVLKADLRVALVHHPLDWLSGYERSNIQASLETSVDILLRGHLHETEAPRVGVSRRGELLHVAAGAAYQTRGWPNRALYATFEDQHVTIFPIRYEDSPREVWTVDPSVFPEEPGYVGRCAIARLAAPAAHLATPAEEHPMALLATPEPSVAPPRYDSNIASRRGPSFVGRDELLQEMLAALDDPSAERVLVLHGPPGVGKSELAREFARRQRQRYPGGTYFVDASSGDVLADLVRVGVNHLGLNFPPGLPLPDQCEQTLLSLGTSPTLLIYDNARSVESMRRWLPRAGMSCHTLITTVLDRWNLGWPCLPVAPLSLEVSVELIRDLAGPQVTERYGKALAEMAGGLPVQLCPAAATLAYEARLGRLDSVRLAMTAEARRSFGLVYERLESPLRLLLHAAAFLNCQRIAAQELYRHVSAATGWSEVEFQRLLDACRDLHLLEGDTVLRMHQLFAAYVLGNRVSGEDAAALERIRHAQQSRMLELARALSADPANGDLATALTGFPLAPEASGQAGAGISALEGKAVGEALAEIGKFEEARPWYEQAVAEAEKGDVHGRVDHESLGGNLHAVGLCLSSVGKFAEARPWYERAVGEREKGDAHGRVNHASLSGSLHQVGFCLGSVGKFAEARPWHERAVEEADKGDVHGRVDHASLGRSLHAVGFCLASVGEFGEARPWYERAVVEAEKGDVDGHIDHTSLGASLHEVGSWLFSVGKFEEARPWHERAVQEKGKGDAHGRVDHASLGGSMHQVGFCLSSVGKFAEARPWYERAVAEAEKGDVHGRVDHESLGRSLYQVGFCLSSAGEFEEARPWYERAVSEAEKGDVHGRVDHESLGGSMHAAGFCLSSVGKFHEARPSFERAVAEREMGEVHGRVDHTGLGTSLYQVGFCLASVRKFEEARPWYERAVAEAEKGDVHGRVDHVSLGKSLHAAGLCLSSVGKFREARPSFERAVAEKEKGDVYGRIDHETLGMSLHAVGSCLSSAGKFEEARPWYERAVEEAEKGDVHERVDHESVGMSLHQVGLCLSSAGRFEEARPWYERAVEEKEKGNVHGRADHESLGVSLRAGADCLRRLGLAKQAGSWEKRASRLRSRSSPARPMNPAVASTPAANRRAGGHSREG